LGGVVSGLIWPVAMVQMGTMIDNPWTSGLDKYVFRILKYIYILNKLL